MSAIRGIVAAVPKNVVANEDAEFVRVTGIRERRIAADGHDTLVLGTHAAAHLLGEMAWRPEEIGAIVFVTQTPPVRMPATACALAGTLGIPCAAFDVNLACSGYVYGLWIASHLPYRRVLLMAGDTVSKMVDPNDKSTAMLFGDAVTATAVENVPPGIRFATGTDGSGFKKLIADPLIRMDGSEVFNFTLQTVPGLVSSVVGELLPDYYLFHQANALILNQLARKCKIPLPKFPMNIERYGNTSSASIPLLMADSHCTEDLKTRTTKLAMFGFGAGWSYAGATFEQQPMKVLERIQI